MQENASLLPQCQQEGFLVVKSLKELEEFSHVSSFLPIISLSAHESEDFHKLSTLLAPVISSLN